MGCEKHQKDFVANCHECLKPLCPECASVSRGHRTFCLQCALALSAKEEAEVQALEEAQRVQKAERKKRLNKKILLYIGIGLILIELGLILAGRFFGHRHPDPLPSAVSAQQQQEFDYSACVANLAGLNSAVKLYKQENRGASPTGLLALTVKYFPVEPRCPATGKSYVFTPVNGGYEIICPDPRAHGKKNLRLESSVGLVVEELPGGSP